MFTLTKKLNLFLLLCLLCIGLQPWKTLRRFLQASPDGLPTKKKLVRFYFETSSFAQNSSARNHPYYRHATAARNSSFPFISGDTFRAFSEFIFDETRRDDLSSVKYGDLVFVKADSLSSFFAGPFNSIRHPFVLISHNSDFPAPAQYESHLANPNILMWYASNPSRANITKVSPIPIGLANTRWGQGDLNKIDHAVRHSRKSWSNRTSLLYVNFAIGTNRNQREKALAQASKFTNVQINKERISFETYLQHVGNAKFVLSPPGNGLDCHRTWEALVMGAVPIVLSSGLDPLFANARAVILKDWPTLTQEFLLSLNMSFDEPSMPDVLSAVYWHETLLAHRTKKNATLP